MAGQQQIINGQQYEMYTPAWYAANDANQIHQADVAGQAAGTSSGAAAKSQWQTKYPGVQTPGPYDYQNVLSGLSGAIGSALGTGGGGFQMPQMQNSSFGSVPQQNSFQAPQSTQQQAVHLSAPDTSAAENASFARAKDQVGLQTRGALTGLAGAMAGRGVVGSGVEGRGQLGVVNQGQQQLADVSRQQAITHADLAQKNAEMAYSGGITQRGQDIGQNLGNGQLALGAYNSGIQQRGQDIQQRGQDMSQQNAQNQLALQAAQAQNQASLQRQQLALEQLNSLSKQFATFRPAY